METSKLKILKFKKRRDGIYKKKGRQDRDGMNEAWLTNADSPNPITQSLYSCLGEVLNIQHYNSQDLKFQNTKNSWYQVTKSPNGVYEWHTRQQYRVMESGVSACSNIFVNHASCIPSLSCLPFFIYHPLCLLFVNIHWIFNLLVYTC